MKWRFVLAILVCGLFTSAAFAQSDTLAYFTFESDVTRIGTPLQLTVTVEAPSAIAITEWPDLSEDTWIEVVATDDPEEQTLNDLFVYTQTYRVVFWQFGQYLTPEVVVTTANGTVDVQSDFITIESLVSQIENPVLRPDRTPIDLPITPRWFLPVIITSIIIVVLIVVRFVQIGSYQIRGLVRGTPAQLAIAHLEDLKAQPYSADVVYPSVVNQVRHYIQQQFNIQTSEMTSSELLEYLREDDPFGKPARQGLKQMLDQADLVKFANFTPDAASNAQFINFAIRWIRTVDRQKVRHDD